LRAIGTLPKTKASPDARISTSSSTG
jgi:hypothetical protein